MIYLDNAATSFPKAPGVADAVKHFLTEIGANAGRSSYQSARQSSRLIYQTRKLLAKLLQVDNSERICLTMNTTHALNTAIKGLVKENDLIITSPLEHNSVMRPLRWLEKSKNISLKFFSIINDQVDFASLEVLLKQNPAFLVFTAASNVNGLVLPYKQIAELAHSYNIPVILDAAQALGSLPVKGDDFDIVCFPGHKGLLAPMGTGGLYVNKNIELQSLMQGGTGSHSSEELQPEEYPDHLESGTPNLPGIAGLKTALEFIAATGIAAIKQKKSDLTSLLLNGLLQINQLTVHSPRHIDKQAGVVSFTSDRYSVSELAWKLDSAQIACRMGLHCAPSAHRFLNTFSGGGTLRLSPGFFNSESEVMQVIDLLKEIH
jgi:cysteine desulfurase family protein